MTLYICPSLLLCTLLGCYVPPIATRLLPITLNSSRHANSSAVLGTSVKHTTRMQLDLLTPSIISTSSELQQLNIASISTSISLLPPLQLSTPNSDSAMNSLTLDAPMPPSELFTITSVYVTSSMSLTSISTLITMPSSATSTAGYDAPIGLDTSSISAASSLPPSSLVPTDESHSVIPMSSSSSVLLPAQSPTPKPPDSLSTTHLGLIIGLSVFGLVIIVGIGIFLTFMTGSRISRRRGRESQSRSPSTHTQDELLCEVGQAVNGEKYGTAALKQSCSKIQKSGDKRVSEIRHRIKSAELEAWKTGVILELKPEAEVVEGKGMNTEEAEGAIGTAI